MKKEVVAHQDPKSPISEIFRTLRTNIQFINTNKNIQTLLVTSTLPGEGKSWIASNLSVAFAQTGKKVVLIDADMRKGRQYLIFDTLPTPGLSNYLSKVGINAKQNTSDEILDCIQKTEVPNLYLMPAGSIPPNPSELLVSGKMIKVLEKFKQAFDIIIIDGTPCELVTDSVILSRVVDSTIIVTAHKVTKKDALERVIKSIQNVGGNLTGVVVNKMPISGKKYEKRYYYYGESSENTSKRSNVQAQIEKEPKLIKEEKEEIKNTTTIKKEPKPISIRMKKKETGKSTNSDTKKTSKAKQSNTKKATKPKKEEETKTNQETKTKKVEETETKKATKAKEETKTNQETKKVEETKNKKATKEKTEKEEETKAKIAKVKQTDTKKATKAKKTKAEQLDNKDEETDSKTTTTKQTRTKKETKAKAEKTIDSDKKKSVKTAESGKTKTTKKVEPKEEESSINKTEDILKKMNEYLEKENSKKEKEEKDD